MYEAARRVRHLQLGPREAGLGASTPSSPNLPAYGSYIHAFARSSPISPTYRRFF
ncbi:hypothetical protein [Paenibacillus aestuarii]|uniref:Uncharacterized protein n=1 Tax=Paenibacillus aestuarii TaxID=516965 RepID=A0ABW0KHH8_9BACL|nr:hypothetical protein [Paenibacillus aestuarii]